MYNIFEILLAVTIISVTASVGSCSYAENSLKHETARALATKGMDPLDIPCASGLGTERYCEMRAVIRKHEEQKVAQ